MAQDSGMIVTLITRRRWDCYFAPAASIAGVIGAVTAWYTGYWRSLCLPLVFLPFWLFVRQTTPKSGTMVHTVRTSLASKIVGISFLALVVAVVVGDYVLVRSKERRLSSTVWELGGRMGSVPAWPLGTEYRITFERPLNQEELDRLKIANRMRGWVGIAFRDCALSEAEKSNARKALPSCHLFVLRGDTMVPMNGR